MIAVCLLHNNTNVLAKLILVGNFASPLIVTRKTVIPAAPVVRSNQLLILLSVPCYRHNAQMWTLLFPPQCTIMLETMVRACIRSDVRRSSTLDSANLHMSTCEGLMLRCLVALSAVISNTSQTKDSKSPDQRCKQKIFMGEFHSVAYGGHLYLVCAVCEVTIRRHINIFKPTFWRSLLTQDA